MADPLVSDPRLSQLLHRVVRDAVREEMQAQLRTGSISVASTCGPQDLKLAGSEAGCRLPGGKSPDLPAAEDGSLSCDLPTMSMVLQPRAHQQKAKDGGNHSTSTIKTGKTGQSGPSGRAKSTLSGLLCESERSTSFIDNVSRGSRQWLRNVVHSKRFDVGFGILIVLNAICVGWEIQAKLDGENVDHFVAFESFFIVCFIIEIVLRLMADGRKCFQSGWFIFDVLLVCSGVTATWIIEPIQKSTDLNDVPMVAQVLTLRVLRLMRLVRALRLVDSFVDLWKLCSGLIKSARTMISVGILILLSVYIFACVGVDAITKSETLSRNERTDVIVKEHFSSVPVVMMTLMQFANADSIAAIYAPLCKEQPFLVLYFLSIWLIVTVSLMNLVTAIIVENALSDSDGERQDELRRKRMLLREAVPAIRQTFRMLDADHSGSVTTEEIEAALKENALQLPGEVQKLIDQTYMLDRWHDVFQVLDSDGSGTVDEDEFVNGVCVLALSSVPFEVTQILQMLRVNNYMITHNYEVLERLAPGDFCKSESVRLDKRHSYRGGV